MKIDLTEKEQEKFFKLEQNELDLWSFTINTRKGRVIGSNIDDKEEAIKQATKHLITILKSIIK